MSIPGIPADIMQKLNSAPTGPEAKSANPRRKKAFLEGICPVRPGTILCIKQRLSVMVASPKFNLTGRADLVGTEETSRWYRFKVTLTGSTTTCSYYLKSQTLRCRFARSIDEDTRMEMRKELCYILGIKAQIVTDEARYEEYDKIQKRKRARPSDDVSEDRDFLLLESDNTIEYGDDPDDDVDINGTEVSDLDFDLLSTVSSGIIIDNNSAASSTPGGGQGLLEDQLQAFTAGTRGNLGSNHVPTTFLPTTFASTAEPVSVGRDLIDFSGNTTTTPRPRNSPVSGCELDELFATPPDGNRDQKIREMWRGLGIDEDNLDRAEREHNGFVRAVRDSTTDREAQRHNIIREEVWNEVVDGRHKVRQGWKDLTDYTVELGLTWDDVQQIIRRPRYSDRGPERHTSRNLTDNEGRRHSFSGTRIEGQHKSLPARHDGNALPAQLNTDTTGFFGQPHQAVSANPSEQTERPRYSSVTMRTSFREIDIWPRSATPEETRPITPITTEPKIPLSPAELTDLHEATGHKSVKNLQTLIHDSEFTANLDSVRAAVAGCQVCHPRIVECPPEDSNARRGRGHTDIQGILRSYSERRQSEAVPQEWNRSSSENRGQERWNDARSGAGQDWDYDRRGEIRHNSSDQQGPRHGQPHSHRLQQGDSRGGYDWSGQDWSGRRGNRGSELSRNGANSSGSELGRSPAYTTLGNRLDQERGANNGNRGRTVTFAPDRQSPPRYPEGQTIFELIDRDIGLEEFRTGLAECFRTYLNLPIEVPPVNPYRSLDDIRFVETQYRSPLTNPTYVPPVPDFAKESATLLVPETVKWLSALASSFKYNKRQANELYEIAWSRLIDEANQQGRGTKRSKVSPWLDRALNLERDSMSMNGEKFITWFRALEARVDHHNVNTEKTLMKRQVQNYLDVLFGDIRVTSNYSGAVAMVDYLERLISTRLHITTELASKERLLQQEAAVVVESITTRCSYLKDRYFGLVEDDLVRGGVVESQYPRRESGTCFERVLRVLSRTRNLPNAPFILNPPMRTIAYNDLKPTLGEPLMPDTLESQVARLQISMENMRRGGRGSINSLEAEDGLPNGIPGYSGSMGSHNNPPMHNIGADELGSALRGPVHGDPEFFVLEGDDVYEYENYSSKSSQQTVVVRQNSKTGVAYRHVINKASGSVVSVQNWKPRSFCKLDCSPEGCPYGRYCRNGHLAGKYAENKDKIWAEVAPSTDPERMDACRTEVLAVIKKGKDKGDSRWKSIQLHEINDCPTVVSKMSGKYSGEFDLDERGPDGKHIFADVCFSYPINKFNDQEAAVAAFNIFSNFQ